MAQYYGGPVRMNNIRRAVAPRVHRITDDIHRNARRNMMRHVRTGWLLATVRRVKTSTGGRIYVGTDHWKFIEYGTKRHEIRPKHKRALYWLGAPYPVARVQHPGTRAYSPMRRALRARVRL